MDSAESHIMNICSSPENMCMYTPIFLKLNKITVTETFTRVYLYGTCILYKEILYFICIYTHIYIYLHDFNRE